MKTLISSLIKCITASPRLVIEYILIAVVVTLCGATATMWFQKVKLREDLAGVQVTLATTQAQLTTLELAKRVQDKTILELQRLREKDNDALQGLTEDYENLIRKDTTVRNRLRELEKNDENVRKYLDNQLPPDVKCLLNATCGKDRVR